VAGGKLVPARFVTKYLSGDGCIAMTADCAGPEAARNLAQ
jgi:hypothetical protein